MTSNGLKQ